MTLGLSARKLLATLMCFGLGAPCLTDAAHAQPPGPAAATASSLARTSDAAAMYAKMILTMSAQPSPSVAEYDVTLNPKGLDVRIIRVRGKAVVHLAFSSDKAAHIYHVKQYVGQDTADIVDANSSQRYTAEQAFWAAAWPTVHPGHGMSPIASDQTTVISSTREKALTDLLILSDSAYNVSFIGTENLDGSPVYHLRLIAREQATMHPLTDVFVDEHSYRARRVVASFTDHTVTNVTGTLTLNFGRIGNFWMQTSGGVDATVHAFFRRVSGSATFAVSHVTIPP